MAPTSFLSLPIEIRLCIYSLVIGPSECFATPAPYFCYTIQGRSTDSLVLSRSGFRKWDYRRTLVWAKWPDHDTTALCLTSQQIHIDLAENFHPFPQKIALTVVDDICFGVVGGETLYPAISERSWLFSRLEILRLELIGDIENRFKIKDQSSALERLKDEVTDGLLLNAWQRLSCTVMKGLFPMFRTPTRKNRYHFNTTKLAQYLTTLPSLKKLEVHVDSTEVLERWVDPFDDLKPLHDLGVIFAVIIGPSVSVESLAMMVASHHGKLNRLNGVVVDTAYKTDQSSIYAELEARRDMCIIDRDGLLVTSVYFRTDAKMPNKDGRDSMFDIHACVMRGCRPR